MTTDKLAETVSAALFETPDYRERMMCRVAARAVRAALSDGSLSPADLGMEPWGTVVRTTDEAVLNIPAWVVPS